MREAFYRALFDGKWVFGSLDTSSESTHIIERETAYVYTVDLETTGQYTGLRDKNDLMIFRGDIVLLHHEPPQHGGCRNCEVEITKVEWKRTYAAWVLCREAGDDVMFCDVDISSMEVIGTIYDTLEFLEPVE